MCGFASPSPFKFTQHYAPNATFYVAGVCTQFCFVEKNETLDEFSSCVEFLLPANQILGGLGCSNLKKSERARKFEGRGVMVWLTVGVLVTGVLLS
jgi:hypothetical protein